MFHGNSITIMCILNWCPRPDSNRHMTTYEVVVLPLNYRGSTFELYGLITYSFLLRDQLVPDFHDFGQSAIFFHSLCSRNQSRTNPHDPNYRCFRQTSITNFDEDNFLGFVQSHSAIVEFDSCVSSLFSLFVLLSCYTFAGSTFELYGLTT